MSTVKSSTLNKSKKAKEIWKNNSKKAIRERILKCKKANLNKKINKRNVSVSNSEMLTSKGHHNYGNKKPKRSFDSVNPSSSADSYGENGALIEVVVVKSRNNLSGKKHELILDTSSDNFIESMSMEIANMENNLNYLTPERVSRWGEVSKQVRKFNRIVVGMSIFRGVNSTMNLTQGEYFERYYGFSSSEVSKILRCFRTSLFLYLGVNSIDELDENLDLLKIGDENNYVLDKFDGLRKKSGDEFTLIVFKECKKLIASNTTLSKISGTLVDSVSNSMLQSNMLKDSISTGAHDEFGIVKLEDIHNTCPEQVVNLQNMSTSLSHKSSKVELSVASLKVGLNHINDIVDNIDEYAAEELKLIIDVSHNLNKLVIQLK